MPEFADEAASEHEFDGPSEMDAAMAEVAGEEPVAAGAAAVYSLPLFAARAALAITFRKWADKAMSSAGAALTEDPNLAVQVKKREKREPKQGFARLSRLPANSSGIIAGCLSQPRSLRSAVPASMDCPPI